MPKLTSVTARPGTHTPQVLDLNQYSSLELLSSGVVKATSTPSRGKVQITYLNSWDTARDEVEVEEAPAKTK